MPSRPRTPPTSLEWRNRFALPARGLSVRPHLRDAIYRMRCRDFSARIAGCFPRTLPAAMKSQLQHLLDLALQQLQASGVIPADWANKSTLERTRDRAHGDWASNLAMVASKAAGMKPRDLAEKVVAAIPANDVIVKTDIAGPGFINFFLQEQAEFAVLGNILSQKQEYKGWMDTNYKSR